MVYLVVFALSISTCYIGEILNESIKGKRASKLLFAIAVLLLVALAGCRDYSIGTDIRIYGNLIFNGATRYNDLTMYLKAYSFRAEPLYLILNYAISRLTSSAHWLYAAIGAIIYTGFFVGIFRFRRYISITYSWIIFILLFYTTSFNLMRQMLAMSMLFMGSIHVFNKRYARFLPYTILAALFHQTSIVFAAAIVGMRVLILRRHTKLYQFLIFFGAVFLIFGYSLILRKLTGLGVLAEKYNQYIYQFHFIIAINPLIQRAFPIVLFYFLSKIKYDDELATRAFLQSMMYLDFILITMGSLGDSPLQRVAFYCSMYNVYTYPFLLRRIRLEGNKRIVGSLIVIALVGIWIYQVVYRGNAEVWPYTSEVLGIR